MQPRLFDLKKLPEKTIINIFGRLNLADLIVAKNVSRWFNLRCKKFILDMYETLIGLRVSYICEDVICDYTNIETYTYVFNHYLFDDAKLIDVAAAIMSFADGSVEECIWLFALKHVHFRYKSNLLSLIIDNVLNTSHIPDSTIIYYFRKYYYGVYDTVREDKRDQILAAVKKHRQNKKVSLLRKILRMIFSDVKNKNMKNKCTKLHIQDRFFAK